MKNKIKIKGQLKRYLQWPVSLTILLLLMCIAVFTIDIKAGAAASFFLVIYIFIVIILYYSNRPNILNELVSFATQYGQVQKNLLRDFVIPYALLDRQGKILWMNTQFSNLCEKDKKYNKSINGLFSQITAEKLPTKEDVQIRFQWREKDYLASMTKVSMDEVLEESDMIEAEEDNYLIALYLFDETEINQYKRWNDEEKLVAGLLYLDNYEEALNSVEEVRRSLLTALIDRKLNKYFAELDVLVKKIEKDKYFLVMRKRSLMALEQQRFNILEDVKTVNIGNDMSLTISMGIGLNGESYSKNYEYARMAIELALGRGGDQAVVKDDTQITYYGGKSQHMGTTTRVKARVKAHALKEFMSNKDKVVVMGHKITDADSFGASVGIFCAAKSIGKKAHIVINTPTSSIRPLISSFLENPDYDGSMFVDSAEAKEIVDDDTVVVVVDTNRPSYTDCEDLLDKTSTIVVLDHHRQGSEVIQNAVLSYIEPYASSACEMTAEILQYFSDDIRIRNVEADSLYAGIMIDTNNFMVKTGVRTFEAAAFLRRCGADVTRIRKMFRENIESYKARAEAIRRVEKYRGFAIAHGPSEGLESPTVVAAQAANELLNIEGVKASFVLTEYNDMIYISARALDEVNVQIIMERLGGGGHINVAAAQLKTMSVHAATTLLKKTIDEMIEEGDI